MWQKTAANLQGHCKSDDTNNPVALDLTPHGATIPIRVQGLRKQGFYSNHNQTTPTATAKVFLAAREGSTLKWNSTCEESPP